MQVRSRIVLTSAAAIIAIAAVLLLWSQSWLEPALELRATSELERTARAIAAALGDEPPSDAGADRFGEAAGLRVTFIARDGRVLGDSDVDEDRLPELEDHSTRPEVRAANGGSVGHAVRASNTVSRRLLYVAVPAPFGVVRVSTPYDDTMTVLIHSRRAIIVASAAALLLILSTGRPLERWILRDASNAAATLALTAGGKSRARAEIRDHGPLGELIRAAESVSATVDERLLDLEGDRDDLDRIFSELEDGIAVIDAEGIVVRANRSFERWAGRDNVVGQRFTGLFRPPEISEAIERAAAGHQVSRELRLGDHTVLLTIQPHRGGTLAVIEDLTRLRRLEGVRRDFVANVSHELKTPLTSILGFAEAMAAGDLPAEQRADFGRRILSNAMRMRRLVDDLLDLALFESGGWSPDPRPADTAGIARRAWASLAPLPEEQDIRLHIAADSFPAVHADLDGVQQLFRNLFENALRYAPAGSEVSLAATAEGPMLRLEVRDTGPGIPTVHAQRIFERFYRVDAARSRAGGGTGLGLSIVRHIVAAHGGDVGVESEVGKGTMIWFTLPLSATGATERA